MRKPVLIGIAILFGACASDKTVGPPAPASVTGTYLLNTVDGAALPYPILDLGAYKAAIGSATLKLSTDGKYSFVIGVRIDDSGNIRATSDSDAGFWTMSHDSLSLSSTEGNPAKTATVAGDVLRLQASTLEFLMRR